MNSLCESHPIRMNRRVLDRAAREISPSLAASLEERSTHVACFLELRSCASKVDGGSMSHRSEIRCSSQKVRQPSCVWSPKQAGLGRVLPVAADEADASIIAIRTTHPMHRKDELNPTKC
eukprot:scaffold882_cov85-Skeletonema_marinoi.AAC.2